ncbi:hypothetical protein SAMN05444671_4665 [Flavobacterium sp. CF108]|uniref:contractile injection system tape measure protein n=1 Tax=unclassified Flavobacterium TaxID=196869 RepID=UPI0008ABB816|nr:MULTISPECIES: contractile injection system tape measure protein [unclassified Flavobacterium]SEP23135.1 hypothetical protein SAMN04487978_0153 [Flavobacterium sp. fv08]SHI00505.1 hypothetical protein SAMN05444671_4665 [Flavobacterium sp. CF108]
MNKISHSIQKVFLEIDTPSMAMANSIKNNLAVFLQNEVIPILEKQFNSIKNIDNQIIQIEKLEINLQSIIGKNDVSFSNNHIKNQIEKEVQKALNELQKTSENEGKRSPEILTISPEDKDLKTFLYFIENGSMPWWVSNVNEVEFFKKITSEQLKNDVFKIAFKRLMEQKKVQNRIINQFSNQEIALLSSAVFGLEKQQKAVSKNILIKLLHQKTHAFKAAFWQLIFDFWVEKKPLSLIKFYYKEQSQFSADKIIFEDFIENIKTFVPLDFTTEELIQMKKDHLVSEKEKPIIKTNSDTIKEENKSESEIHLKEESIIEDEYQEDSANSKSCYVQNAGLIILHPFLKEMLKSCGLMDDNNTLLNKELTAHILHYAATKRENDYEHLMLFEKFLCGIPLQQSIQKEVKIEDKHKQQVEEMLDSAVYHWSALKNTSTAVLRTEFLQREGKLDWSESNPKLTIERKTQDLLLEKIPWNISIVKIPWIQKLIYTQW